MSVQKTSTLSLMEFIISIKQNPCNPVNTCKLDSWVNMHSKILKKKIFLDFFGYNILETKSLTPDTYIQGTMNIFYLHQVELIANLTPRIIFIIDELISQSWHHMDYQARAMPHRN
jgi:hypothetical protein